MPECMKCGSFVTRDFVRVFGNNESKVYGCPKCTPYTNLIDGVAADPEL